MALRAVSNGTGRVRDGVRGGGSGGPSPTLVMDFTTGGLPAPVAATGGTNGTRVNSSGLLVPASAPRFTYNPVTLAPSGLLAEEARTNLTVTSNNFMAIWGGDGASPALISASAPDGTTTTHTITDSGGSGRHILYRDYALSAGPYVASQFFKADTLRYVYIGLSGTSTFGVVADLQTGVITDTRSVGSPASPTYGIEPYGNGIYRVWAGYTVGTETVYQIVGTSNIAVPTYDGNGQPAYTGTGQRALIWFNQLEAGKSPSTYIPNATGSSITRTADDLSWNATQLAGGIWTLVWQGIVNALPADVALATDAGSPFDTLMYASVGSGTFNTFSSGHGANSSGVSVNVGTLQSVGVANSAASHSISVGGSVPVLAAWALVASSTVSLSGSGSRTIRSLTVY